MAAFAAYTIIGLSVLGLVVAHAAGLLPASVSASGGPHPGGVASGARLH